MHIIVRFSSPPPSLSPKSRSAVRWLALSALASGLRGLPAVLRSQSRSHILKFNNAKASKKQGKQQQSS